MPAKGPEKHIPVYSVVNDYFFPGQLSMVRMGFGVFVEAIKEVKYLLINHPLQVYKKTLKRDLEIIQCGKPFPITYDFARKRGADLASRYGLGVQNFYMIGDNPSTDIKGAKAEGYI